MERHIPLEIPIFSSPSSIPAKALNAARFELNAPGSYPSGGLTPPLSVLASLPTDLRTPLRIMIRPRGAPTPPEPDFVYTRDEVRSMLASIREFKASGLLDLKRGDGFVFGVLRVPTASSSQDENHGRRLAIDRRLNTMLVDEARPFRCSFHRAFDDVLGAGVTPKDAVEDLMGCGFDGLLTSGGPGNAVDNLGRLRDVISAVSGRMDVLVGGGVRASNAREILEALGVKGASEARRVWLHSSCLDKASATEEVSEREVGALLGVMGDVSME